MEQKRTATEVLLNIEDKINSIYNFMQNLDNTTKLILNRLNNLERNNLNNQPKVITSFGVSAPSVSAPLDDPSLKKEKNSNKKAKINTPKKLEETQPQNLDESKKIVSVSQKILHSNGSEATFADVELFDSDGNSITTTKTNTSGRWIKTLNPGNYKAKIYKKGNGKDYQDLNLNFSFSVKDSDTPIELPTPLYNKK